MTEKDLFEFCIDERISEIIGELFDEMIFKKTKDKKSEFSKEEIFIQNLSDEQLAFLSHYQEVCSESSAAQEKFLYKCGLKDGFKLFLKLNEL